MTLEQLPSQEPDRPRLPGTGELSNWLSTARTRTPARIFVGRAGPALRTKSQLELKADHAAALDAVHDDFEPERHLGRELVSQFGLFLVDSCATTKSEFLLRPDLGRNLSDAGARLIQQRCAPDSDLQVVIGDGLSARAVAVQVPALLPKLADAVRLRGWSFGNPFCVRRCRVGILNEIGELLHPSVVVLLIGERPGLATAESLSAYLAYRPKRGHTDARRNLISNIHARGVSPVEAVGRILALAEQMRTLRISGVDIKEQNPATLPGPGTERRLT